MLRTGGALAVLVALAACSSTATTTAGPATAVAPAATPTSSAPVPEAFVGAWTRIITADDWKHAGGYPAGT